MNPQQSMQEFYQNLTQKHTTSPDTQPDPHKQLIKNFKHLNKSIQQRLQHYCQLTDSYVEKVQDNFLVTFSKVLEKMGTDLILAEQAYKNINKEIMEKQKCVNLNQDKLFFIHQSTYYKQELQFKTKQAEKLKEKNFLLVKQNTGLKEKLFQKVQDIMLLKQKCKKLQKIHIQNRPPVQMQTQEHTIKPTSPQKFTDNLCKTQRMDRKQRKWASLGRQTEEQKLKKEYQKSKEKKVLFVEIRKEVKTREHINLDSIINRSFVDETTKEVLGHQFRSRKKKVHFSEMQNGMMIKLADVVQKSAEMPEKNGCNSTVATQFEMTFNNSLTGKRSLHTSGQRTGRSMKL